LYQVAADGRYRAGGHHKHVGCAALMREKRHAHICGMYDEVWARCGLARLGETDHGRQSATFVASRAVSICQLNENDEHVGLGMTLTTVLLTCWVCDCAS